MWFLKKSKLALEEQLQTLRDCGFVAHPGITIEDFLESGERKQYEDNPFQTLFGVLGGEVQREPYPRFSDCFHLIDLECIYADGDYCTIALDLARLSRGDIHLSNLVDKVDCDSEQAWITFDCKLNGLIEHVRYDFAFNNDFMDRAILTGFSDLLARTGSKKRYFEQPTLGQDVLIICAERESVVQFEKMTKIKFLQIK